MAFALRQRNIRRSLTCPICEKIFRQVTTVEDCSHRFCEKCITKKITEEGLHNCPICYADLGSAPLQKLRVDYVWQRVLDEFNERYDEGNTENERTKHCQVTKQEIQGFQASNPTVAEPSSRTRSSCRNEKQKFVGETLPSRELRAKRQQGENKSIRGSRNPTEIQDDSSNVEKEEAFWFSLVASDKQKCKAPLKQIPARYLRVKDGNVTVSSIKKYLSHKLNLRSENEVEISLHGHPLLPDLQIYKLVDLWLKTRVPIEKKNAFVGSSARDFVLVLTYARRPVAS